MSTPAALSVQDVMLLTGMGDRTAREIMKECGVSKIGAQSFVKQIDLIEGL